jgi:polar amino acid transport system substrate-binding protein
MRLVRSILSVSVVAAVLAAGACSDDGSSPDQGTATTAAGGGGPDGLVHDGALTVCRGVVAAPFQVDGPTGGPSGFAIELLGAIADDAGLRLQLADPSVESGVAGLAEGDCDVVASWPKSSASDDVAVTQPFYDTGLSLLVRRADAETFGTLVRLMGQRIGVVGGSAGAQYAASHTPEGAQVVTFDDSAALVASLVAGEVAAAMEDLPVSAAAVAADPALALAELFTTGEQYCFAIGADAGGLETLLDHGLDRLQTDGRFEAIYAKYFGGN